MGRKKKADDERLTYSLKLRPEFGKKLAMVADELGYDPGVLVEEKLNTWISGEYLRVLETKLAKARDEAKRK